MRNWSLWKYWSVLLVAGVVTLGGVVTAHAQTSSSTNYKITESQFGSSTNREGCSGQYCAQTSLGDMSSGTSKSSQSSATFGPVTPDEPLLEVIVNSGITDLGDFTTEQTSTKTMVVKIRNYLSDGYTLQITGTPPKYKNHALKTNTSPTISQAGVEQFGINAAVNTEPSVGANPLQVPSNTVSFGEVTSDYSIPNRFKYVSGDVVARSETESGQTDYTISMIVNVANSTPAGKYSGDFSAVVIPVY